MKVADRTTSMTVSRKKGKLIKKRKDVKISKRRSKFRKGKKKTLVEKRKNAIDTKGEKRGLTLRKYLNKRKKKSKRRWK